MRLNLPSKSWGRDSFCRRKFEPLIVGKLIEPPFGISRAIIELPDQKS
jgi:hypothetical protein